MKNQILLSVILISIICCKHSPTVKNIDKDSNESLIGNTLEVPKDSLISKSSSEIETKPQYFKIEKINSNSFRYSLKNIIVEIEICGFKIDEHKITYSTDYPKMVVKINGMVYNAESEIPRKQLCGINISFDGVRKSIDYSIVKNIFEPNFYYEENSSTGKVICYSNVYLQDNKVVIDMANGDGANWSNSKLIINKNFEVLFVKYPYSTKIDDI